MKILDCTIRDGGYYTNWDFDSSLIEEYARKMERLPIEYVEVGYRSPLKSEYFGQYFYCPVHVLEKLKRLMPTKELAIILNEKDIRPSQVSLLLSPISNLVSMIRIAASPDNFQRAIELVKAVKSMGFKVALNLMYMSKWDLNTSFIKSLKEVESDIDFFYMVDSYGGMTPLEVRDIVSIVKSHISTSLGFHGHDNLHMALINSITAVEAGCDIIDCTLTGMGRGAGNLQTEMLLTFLESKGRINFNHSELSTVVRMFETLKYKYRWGSSLPYMFSGANSLPQKEVMEWVSMKRYSLPSMITALNNKKNTIADNVKFPSYVPDKSYETVVIVGGGESVLKNIESIKLFIDKQKDCHIIHAGVKNLDIFTDVTNNQLISLVGVEDTDRIEQSLAKYSENTKLVYPPFPRKMGVSTSEFLKSKSVELDSISFTDKSTDSPFVVSIQSAIRMNPITIYLVGFDGYRENINENNQVLAKENQNLINDLVRIKNIDLYSLTPTRYEGIKVISLFGLI